MKNKLKPCILCVAVSALWLIASLLVALGYMDAGVWQIPIALLMGTSIMGIAGQGEKKFARLAEHPIATKGTAIVICVPLAYIAIINLSVFVVFVEFSVMLVLSYVLFRSWDKEQSKGKSDKNTESLLSKLKNCC